MSADDDSWVIPGDISGLVIEVRCEAPAPLVVNGAAYVGCSLSTGHEGPHKVEITWGNGCPGC